METEIVMKKAAGLKNGAGKAVVNSGSQETPGSGTGWKPHEQKPDTLASKAVGKVADEVKIVFTAREAKDLRKFAKEHKKCGGKIEVCARGGSGIGVSLTGKCEKCGADGDLTDYGCW